MLLPFLNCRVCVNCRVQENSSLQAVAPCFRHIPRNVYFAGLDAELLERAELLSDILWERDRDKTGDTQFMDFVIERLSAHLSAH